MSKRVEDIISNQKTELIWFLEHDSLFTLGTSAKIAILKTTSIFRCIKQKGWADNLSWSWSTNCLSDARFEKWKKDIKQLVWNIEEWLILVLKD